MATPSLTTFDSFLRGQTHGFPNNGNPNWYVKAPMGTLFGRHEWELWMKLPGQPWRQTGYEILDPMSLDRVDQGETWIKTTNELRFDGWRSLGKDPFAGEGIFSAVPTGSALYPLLQLLYALDDTPVVDAINFGEIVDGEFEDVELKIFNSGSAPLLLTASSVVGDTRFSIQTPPNSSSVATGSFTLMTIRAQTTGSTPSPAMPPTASFLLEYDYSSYPDNTASLNFGTFQHSVQETRGLFYTNVSGETLTVTGAVVLGPFQIIEILLNGDPVTFPFTMSGIVASVMKLTVEAYRPFVEINYGSLNVYHGGLDTPHRSIITASFINSD